MTEQLHPDIESIILSEQDIREIVKSLGERISKDYVDKNPLVISVLRGAFVFTADLMRAITVPCAVDFMAVSSYGDGVKSSGVVRIVKDLDTKIEGRHVIIAEDILDSGLTLSYLISMLEARHPASVQVCTLFFKPEKLKEDLTLDYVAFSIPNDFIVGYGLGYDQQGRQLRDVYSICED